MTEAEIFWPESLPTDALLDGAETLRGSGIETTCRLQPVRRGAGLSVLVLLTTSALDPLLKTVFEHVGGEVWKALQRFVTRLLDDDKADDKADGKADDVARASANGRRPEVVVFESASTGAQFVFTTGMPSAAFRQAIELQPGDEPGRWVWDTTRDKWMRFEELRS
jgi:hypothetical protein